MKKKIVSRIMLALLLIGMFGIFVTSTVAEEEYIHSLEVSVSPEFPTTDDEVDVTISFVAASIDYHVGQPPWGGGDFIILIPSDALPIEAPYTFICHLGKLPAGLYHFEVYIAISFCFDGICTFPMPYLQKIISFTVALPPREAIQNLITAIESWSLPQGTENSLTSKLDDAIHLLNKGNENGAIHKLMDFIDQVEALRGKKLIDGQADYLTSEAQRIIDIIKE